MKADYPKDYSFLVHLGDVVFDVLSPSLIEQKAGWKPHYPPGQGMVDLAWYSHDIPGLAAQLMGNGVRIVDQHRTAVDPDTTDLKARLESNLTADSYLLFLDEADAGVPYEFFDMGRANEEFYSRVGDPRLRPGWTLPPTAPDDPLGVIQCSHHTVLTRDPDRALRLYVEILGGTVVERRYDERRDADSVFVAYARSVLEFATPRSGHVVDPRTGDEAAQDVYVGLALHVQDPERAAEHLRREGIAVTSGPRGDVVADAADTFGVEWTFSAAAIPANRAAGPAA
jgi:catechol 2,3-dioxygenase-like lactoylglutathione lyase family enzyme